MCGRFENKSSLEYIAELLIQQGLEILLDEGKKKGPDYNIALTNKIIGINKSDKKYSIRYFNWGIKFSESSPLIFNSRIETIKDKKFWWGLFNKNRAIVPMTGFYEWKKESGRKIPYKIFLPNKETFFVPAIFFNKKEADAPFASLITTTPNKFIKKVHHRMPVIFDELNDAVKFLNEDSRNIVEMCEPFDDKKVMELERASI